MVKLRPQYIKDTAGSSWVVLSKREFDSLIDDFEELEDILRYDKAKKNDTGERVPMNEAFGRIDKKLNRLRRI